MISIRNNNITAFFSAVYLGLLLLLYSSGVLADGYVPTSIGGSLTYGYGYASSANAEAESSNLSLSINMGAYIWQPWFITNTLGLSVGVSRSATEGGGESRAESLSGSTSFDVFPASRVPFHLSYSRSDSRTESALDNINFAGRHFISSRLLMRQSYIGARSFYASLNWARSETESELDQSSTDNVTLNVRKKLPKHTLNGDLIYSTSDATNARTKPEHYGVSMAHSYSPGTSVSLNNAISFNRTDSTGIHGATSKSSSENSQFSTYFGWRPDYKPVSVSGGARVSSASSEGSDITTTETRGFGANVGLAYQMSTRVRINAQATATLTDEDGEQTQTSTESASISYSSDQYLLFGFNYGWAANAAAGNSNTSSQAVGAEEDQNEQNYSMGVNHRASRYWIVGRASSLNLGLAQGVGVFESQPSGLRSQSVTHSASLGLSTRGLNGTTFTSMGVSDSRSFSDEFDTSFQQASASISRNQLLNRFSTVNGSVAFTNSRVSADNAPTDISSSARANVRYQHFRFLSVFGMTLNSDLSWSKRLEDENSAESEEISWQNKVDYYIGRLSLSWTLNANKSGNAEPHYTFYFRATRSF